MPAPFSLTGSVALTGSTQLLALQTAPTNNGLKILSATFTTTSAVPVLVALQNGEVANVFEGFVVTGDPLDGAEGAHIASGDSLSLSLPAGSGQVAYSVELSYT